MMKNALLPGKYRLGENPRKWGVSPGDRLKRTQNLIRGTLLAAMVLWIDAWSATTTLVTWPNISLLWILQGICVLGLAAVGWRNPPDISVIKRIITVSSCAMFGILLANHLASRCTELFEFGASKQPFEQADYKIVALHGGYRGGPSIEIDPFDTGRTVPVAIRESDYHTLRDGNWEIDNRCVRVWQRRSNDGALQIRIWDSRPFLLWVPDVTLVSCGIKQAA